MNANLAGILGFLLMLVGIWLPFAGLAQQRGDMLPMLIALFSFFIGLAILGKAMRGQTKPKA